MRYPTKCVSLIFGVAGTQGIEFLFIMSNSEAAIQALTSRDRPLDVSTHWYRGA